MRLQIVERLAMTIRPAKLLTTLLLVGTACTIQGCTKGSSSSPFAPIVVRPYVPPDLVQIDAINPARGSTLSRDATTFDLTLRYSLTTADSGRIALSVTDGTLEQRPLQPLTYAAVNRGSGQVDLTTTVQVAETRHAVQIQVVLFGEASNSSDAFDRVTYSVVPADR